MVCFSAEPFFLLLEWMKQAGVKKILIIAVGLFRYASTNVDHVLVVG